MLNKIFPDKLIEQIINKILRRLNLVSREEFEIQTKVLAKTRLKLENLERELADLLDKH